MLERRIPQGLPERVYLEADLHLVDTLTERLIAVKRIFLWGKERDVAVAYAESDADVVLVTVPPLKDGQRERRIISGR